MQIKPPLSVVVVTKNEETVIGRCLDSVKEIADEIIVIDSGSTDKTVEIAKNKGATVISREWPGYPKQVQFGINQASNEFVLVLDADEEVSEKLKNSIKTELENPKFDCYQIPRKTYYMGKFLEHIWYPEWRTRLFKKNKVKYEGFLHETVNCYGNVGKLEGDLYHYSFKNIKHQFSKAIDYGEISAKELYKRGKNPTIKHLIINPMWSFIKAFFVQKGFLDGKRGFLASVYMSFSTFMKYAFLYELKLKDKYGKNLWKR